MSLVKLFHVSEPLFDAKKKTLLKVPSQTTSEEKKLMGLIIFLIRKENHLSYQKCKIGFFQERFVIHQLIQT
jgi:hypothetical protein